MFRLIYFFHIIQSPFYLIVNKFQNNLNSIILSINCRLKLEVMVSYYPILFLITLFCSQKNYSNPGPISAIPRLYIKGI